MSPFSSALQITKESHQRVTIGEDAVISAYRLVICSIKVFALLLRRENHRNTRQILIHRHILSIVDDPLVILHKSDDGQKNVKLRASLEELYDLWRQRIEKHRPFQYVVGCEHWRELVLCVGEGVLIPRPETELIVDMVEELVTRGEGFKNGLWADLGIGSGTIAIGVAKVLGSHGRVIATDLSPVAICIAGYNVQRYGLQGMIELREGSWFEPIKELRGILVGLVSNPPYIPSEDIPGLQAEVGASQMLKHGGFFAFETNGEKQSRISVDYMSNDLKDCFSDVKCLLQHHERENFNPKVKLLLQSYIAQ